MIFHWALINLNFGLILWFVDFVNFFRLAKIEILNKAEDFHPYMIKLFEITQLFKMEDYNWLMLVTLIWMVKCDANNEEVNPNYAQALIAPSSLCHHNCVLSLTILHHELGTRT